MRSETVTPRSVPGAGDSLDAVDEVALQVVGLAGGAQGRQSLADLVESDGDLATGEVRAEAEVWPARAEPHLDGLERSGDVEPVGLFERGRVPVG